MEFEKFKKSLQHLEAQYSNLLRASERPELSTLDQEAVKESVIQRFETCYDTLWKHLKRYLIEELGLPEVPNSPKPVLRLAHENHLFQNIDSWLSYAQARVDTAHDYSAEKAEASLELMQAFIADAISLYQTLTGEIWQ